MKKFYYLPNCSTCKKMMQTLDLKDFELIDIKSNPIHEQDIEHVKALAGSYEKLFSRRAQLYKSKGLKDVELSEQDYKKYILEHYTFLKRPVLVDGESIFIGSSPKIKKQLQEKFGD